MGSQLGCLVERHRSDYYVSLVWKTVEVFPLTVAGWLLLPMDRTTPLC